MASWGLILGLAGLIVGIFSSYRRPIWIDEFLQFAFGALPNLETALRLASDTASGVNHGQTGTYFIINYLSLNALGANYMVLRWPSLLAAFIMLLYAVYFLREKGAELYWQVAVLLAYASQVALMYYAGEARSYMPLAAATVGVLCYYSIPVRERTNAVPRLIGWSAVLIGVTMHPYFALYWPALILFSYFTMNGRYSPKSGLHKFLVFANPALLIGGFSLVGLIGVATWLRPQPEFQRDPFEGLRDSGGFAATLAQTHLQLLPAMSPALSIAVLAALLISIVGILMASANRVAGKPSETNGVKNLLPPLVLILLALALSSVLSLISLSNSYWILPRQWVASLALVPVGLVWLLFEVTKSLRLTHNSLARIFAVASVALILTFGVNRLWNQLQVTQSEIIQFNEWQASAVLGKARTKPQPTTNEEWTILANNNVIVGGEVWPELAAYYGY